jgi:hypothetical protein
MRYSAWDFAIVAVSVVSMLLCIGLVIWKSVEADRVRIELVKTLTDSKIETNARIGCRSVDSLIIHLGLAMAKPEDGRCVLILCADGDTKLLLDELRKLKRLSYESDRRFESDDGETGFDPSPVIGVDIDSGYPESEKSKEE